MVKLWATAGSVQRARAGAVVEDQDGGQQAVAGNVGHQQHFARAGDGFGIGVPEADQAEGAEADQFPAEIEDEEVGAVDQADEAADEDQHRAVEAGGGLVVGHVADGIEQHEGAEHGAHESEEDAERVHVKDQGQGASPIGSRLSSTAWPERTQGIRPITARTAGRQKSAARMPLARGEQSFATRSCNAAPSRSEDGAIRIRAAAVMV